MADIVLLNKDGIPVTHEGVEKVKFPTASGGTQTFETPFSMSSTRFYFCRPSGEGWEITYSSAGLGFGENGIVGGFGMSDCQNYGFQNADGNWAVAVLVSKKKLTVGNVYTTAELLNG